VRIRGKKPWRDKSLTTKIISTGSRKQSDCSNEVKLSLLLRDGNRNSMEPITISVASGRLWDLTRVILTLCISALCDRQT
jgi:hypothetical protein